MTGQSNNSQGRGHDSRSSAELKS